MLDKNGKPIEIGARVLVKGRLVGRVHKTENVVDRIMHWPRPGWIIVRGAGYGEWRGKASLVETLGG
jgi:hypothetical protein